MNTDIELFNEPVANAVRTSLFEMCMAICVGADLQGFLQDHAPTYKSLEDLKRWIREALVPRLLEVGGDADKLFKMGELLYVGGDSELPDYNAAIIFVNQRLLARAIAASLDCFYCVGGRYESASTQAEAIERFKETAKRDDKDAILIATSVCDEGVDVPVCDRVILWDMPPNVRCYIQRRGRARSLEPPSKFFLMVGDQEEEKGCAKAALTDFQNKEEQMARLVDFWIQCGTDDDEESEDAGIVPAVVIGRDGVRITCRRAKEVLFTFCSTLRATDEFFSPEPWIYTESDEDSGRYRTVVVLPSSVNPPAARWAMSEWQPSEAKAVREACARQLVKLDRLPWVTPQFRNGYRSKPRGSADEDDDNSVSQELLEQTRRSLSTLPILSSPVFKKPVKSVGRMFAYSLTASWDGDSISMQSQQQVRYARSRQQISAVNKLMLLTPGPIDSVVPHAVGHIPLSATGMGRANTSMGNVLISLRPSEHHGNPSAAMGVDASLMGSLWGFHKEIFPEGEGGPCSDWHDCEDERDFWLLVPNAGVDRAGFDEVLDAFKDDRRLLVDFTNTVRELCRMVFSYNLLGLPPLNPRVLCEVLTPKRCQALVDSERYEYLGNSILQLVVSESVWSKQFSAGGASLEGKLTSDRQKIISRKRMSQKAVEGGILSLMQMRSPAAVGVGGAATKDILVSITSAARSCMLALIGALCDSHGVDCVVKAVTKFKLVEIVPACGLLPHSSAGEGATLDDWLLPDDFPQLVRGKLREPTVTYDTLSAAQQGSSVDIGGYVFEKHPWLLTESLTHASVTSVSASYSNERLEWIGDAVLGAVVLQWLFKLEKPPKNIVEAFTANTCNAHLAKVAVERLGVPDLFNAFSAPLLRAVNRFVNELFSGRAVVRRGPKPLADCVEAIIGAVWLDAGGLAGGGWEAATTFITKNVVAEPDQPLSDIVIDLTSPLACAEPSVSVSESASADTIPRKDQGVKRPAASTEESGSNKREAVDAVDSEEAKALRAQLTRLSNTLDADELRLVIDGIKSRIARRRSSGQ